VYFEIIEPEQQLRKALKISETPLNISSSSENNPYVGKRILLVCNPAIGSLGMRKCAVY